MEKILIVDDMANLRKAVAILLQKQGYSVDQAPNGLEALEKLKKQTFNLIITDLKMDPIDGMQLLKEVRANSPNTEVILLTAFGSIEGSVDAMKLGAYDYFTKPYIIDELLASVQSALGKKIVFDEEPDSIPTAHPKLANIIGESDLMHQVLKMMMQVAKTDCTVLITGQSGTGKELIAKAIHSLSMRKNKPLVTINCGALPESLLESELFGYVRGAFTGAVRDRIGLFQEADGGTLFLDEIGEISPQVQIKLLRVLQDGEIRPIGNNHSSRVNVRIIAATNKNLEKELGENNFREDLYYRLNVIPIHMPPLEKRKSDIPLLVGHFLEKYAVQMNKSIPVITKATMTRLINYDWPGNIRELENMIERTIALTNKKVIGPDDLLFNATNMAKKDYRQALYDDLTLEEIEKNLILQHLKSTSGNQKLTAKKLGISTTTLWRKMKKYQIEV